VHELADGRFRFGLGFGWLKEEFDALNVPFAERVTRFEEAIDILRAAWRSGEVKHEGRHFTIGGVQVTPHVTEILLMLGGNTERALRRAARLGDAGSRRARRRSRSRSGCAPSSSACAARASESTSPFPSCSGSKAPTLRSSAGTPTRASTRS
jgi:alkanesulfonate monooxygenase SsuD/methylene tetrahydromethanopterin reductase-like flavin-dependent oxidoreductase (luciferase family)